MVNTDIRELGFLRSNSQLCHGLVVWAWGNYLSSLCLNSLIWYGTINDHQRDLGSSDGNRKGSVQKYDRNALPFSMLYYGNTLIKLHHKIAIINITVP